MSSVSECLASECPDLIIEERPVRSGEYHRVCGITGRRPANMGGCPLGVVE